jgi:HEAT repeat protein
MIAARIAKALEADARGDDDARWRQLAALHRHGSTDVLAAALALCASGVAAERQLGADILAQLGGTGVSSPHRATSAPVLAALLGDAEADVVVSALFAHGHLELGAEEPVLTALSAHPSEDVRHALAWALPGIGGARMTPLLLQLMRDDDVDVRDWATFGLGSMLVEDTPEIRDALLQRTNDADKMTASEACLGLARRGDRRVTLPLLRALGADFVLWNTVEAAHDLAAPELVPALEALVPRWDLDPEMLAKALAACRNGR